MGSTEKSIEKICKYVFGFSNIDTAFIDNMQKVKLEYSYTQIPDLLKPFITGIDADPDHYEKSKEYDVFFCISPFKLNYIIAEIDDVSNHIGNVVLGPFLIEEPTMSMIQNIIIENKLPISLKNIVKEYYQSLPLLSTYKTKVTAEFLGLVTSNLKFFSNKEICIGELSYNYTPAYTVTPGDINQDTKYYLSLIEERYKIENEAMYAVETGNIDKIGKFIDEDLTVFEKIPDRIPNDPLRSRKNLTFVFNTLLRKAAEKGGLHPLYIDSISEKFAIQIEKTSTIQQLMDLQKNMYSEYCNAVHRLSVKKYNLLIRKAIDYIRFNLNQDLSLDTISNYIQTSPYELSRQFKRETGRTITEYINHQRINEAIFVMENDKISITDVALKVGFDDVNYFTKVFKKLKGVTPSEFRKSK